MDLPTLEYRRTRGDIIEVYKYLNGKYNTDSSIMLPFHQTAGVETRGHGHRLWKRECRTQMRQIFFGFRVVNVWNSLPTEVVKAQNVNCLKGRFDRCTAVNRFSMVWRHIVREMRNATDLDCVNETQY